MLRFAFLLGAKTSSHRKDEVALEVFNERNILVVVLTQKLNLPKRKIFHLFAFIQELKDWGQEVYEHYSCLQAVPDAAKEV